MTGKRPVLPDAADAGMDSANLQAPDRARQGELWDASRGDGAIPDRKAGKGGASATRKADTPGPGAEVQPDGGEVSGAEGDGEAPALGEIARVARYLSALVEEDGRPQGGLREAESGKKVEAVEPPGEDAGQGGEAVEGSEGEAPEQEGAKGAAAELTQALRTFRSDFGRWVEGERRGRRRWAGLAIAAGFPALLMLGVLLEQQFQVIPLHDPTGGWRGHIWDNYGRAIVDCAAEAMRTDAEVNCPLVVRRP